MQQIQDYSILETIAETRKSIVYRAKKSKSDKSVIIKVINTQHPTSAEIARFKQEYDIIKNLDMDGIVKVLDIIQQNIQFAIVLEDFAGISLKDYLTQTKISIRDFLTIAIKLAETLGYIHKKNIIHKDIKPHNIIINSTNKIVKITDFGIANELSHKNEEVYQLDIIEGTLPYMSPEQTGRMNCAVDYRTDLYSLGVTFYEILTGKLPFISNEPIEIIHSHIARQPKPLSEIDQNIPKIISDIVMKLMEKTPEERYQNSYGLMADLQVCLDRFEKNLKIDMFPLCRKDISLRFNIPQVVIGRENEIDSLINAFERVNCGKNEMMLVTGDPGIGKSTVINEIHKPILAKRGYFISGKYGQFKKDVPYSSIIQAFNELIRQILIEKEDIIESWKNKLLNALGHNGKVITDMIPDLKMIIGEQPDMPYLGPQESQHRFNLVFTNFISIFSSEKHPLTIFLDDLQWADTASLKLIQNIITDHTINYLFLIGSYRENEVDKAHILIQTIEEIKKANVTVNQLTLSPLKTESVNQLIVHFLRCEPDHSLDLSTIIYQKTNGNPFFIIQFLKMLFDEQILELDPVSGWIWDINKINALQVTDNVVDLMVAKITKQEQSTQEVLEVCACIGNYFTLEMVSTIMDKSIDKILLEFIKITDEGFINKGKEYYRFHHDRIQEAAYSLLSDDEKSKIHYKIGNLVLKNTKTEELNNNLLYIINQLNASISLIDNIDEKYNLAELNLKAGKKAKASNAYISANNYLKTGISLLANNCWINQYELALSLYTEAIEAAYFISDYNEMERLSGIVLKYTRLLLDKVRIYEIKILAYSAQTKIKEGVIFGLSILKSIGLKFPKKPSIIHIALELIKTKIILSKKKDKDLSDLPEMTDTNLIVKLRLIVCLIPLIMQLTPKLSLLMYLKQFCLTIKYGITVNAPYAITCYGLILCSIGDIDSGYRFSQLGINLAKKLNVNKINLLHVMNAFIRPWKEHIRESIKLSITIYQSGLEIGDLDTAFYSLGIYIIYLYISGKELSQIIIEIEKYKTSIEKFKFVFIHNSMNIIYQVIENLMGKSEHRCSLIGTKFDEERMMPVFKANKNHMLIFMVYQYKMILCYLFHEDEEAYHNLKKASNKELFNFISQTFTITSYYFYYLLILFRVYPKKNKLEQKWILKQIKNIIKKFEKWTKNSPINNLHKYYLIKAEWARIMNQKIQAMQFYEKAIMDTHENDFTDKEAMAYELSALFYQECGLNAIALIYMQNAYTCYERWGATAKLQDLKKRYPEFITTRYKNRLINDNRFSMSISSQTLSETLDLSTVIKSSQTLSSEIDLKKLLNKIMAFLLENAGAQRGFLILQNEKDGKMYIEAEGEVDKEINVLQSIPIDDAERLSVTIVNYVNKTRKNVILNNACHEGEFIADPYIVKNQAKSILCMPISHKGIISGILYLENTLTTNAFTAEHIDLLSILSSQASISIENARLLVHRENVIRLQTELQIAQDIQFSLVPKEPEIDGYEITVYMKPATEVSGDYYDVIHANGKDWIIIGDVSGHGVYAGLVMMMAQTCIHNTLNIYPDLSPSKLLILINKTIIENIIKLGDEKYMTMTVFACHEQGQFIFSGAHQDIMIYRTKKQAVEIVVTKGLWLGIMDDLSDIVFDDQFNLDIGDTMLIYTDGITEALKKNNRDTLFGKQLEYVFVKLGNKSLNDIKTGILKALEDYICNDDVTLLIMRKK